VPQNGANEETFSPSFCVYLVCVRIVGVKPKFVSVPNYEPRLEGIVCRQDINMAVQLGTERR